MISPCKSLIESFIAVKTYKMCRKKAIFSSKVMCRGTNLSISRCYEFCFSPTNIFSKTISKKIVYSPEELINFLVHPNIRVYKYIYINIQNTLLLQTSSYSLLETFGKFLKKVITFLIFQQIFITRYRKFVRIL